MSIRIGILGYGNLEMCIRDSNEDCLQLNGGPEGTAISKWACSSGG